MFSKDQIDSWNCKMNTIDKDDKGRQKYISKEFLKERENNLRE